MRFEIVSLALLATGIHALVQPAFTFEPAWRKPTAVAGASESTITWDSRSADKEAFQCQNGGILLCCDYVGGRDYPCKGATSIKTPDECDARACCFSNGHGYYCYN